MSVVKCSFDVTFSRVSTGNTILKNPVSVAHIKPLDILRLFHSANQCITHFVSILFGQVLPDIIRHIQTSHVGIGDVV